MKFNTAVGNNLYFLNDAQTCHFLWLVTYMSAPHSQPPTLIDIILHNPSKLTDNLLLSKACFTKSYVYIENLIIGKRRRYSSWEAVKLMALVPCLYCSLGDSCFIFNGDCWLDLPLCCLIWLRVTCCGLMYFNVDLCGLVLA